MMKIWYAVLKDSEDNDWGTGSDNFAEALKMAIRMDCEMVAVIENDLCIEIYNIKDDEWKR